MTIDNNGLRAGFVPAVADAVEPGSRLEILLPAPVQEMHAANERNLDTRSNPTASCSRT